MTEPRDRSEPRTGETSKVEKLHGADRSGLGDKGWAEVPEDRVGGHPELETAPRPGPGGVNGPQPQTDRTTGGVKAGKAPGGE